MAKEQTVEVASNLTNEQIRALFLGDGLSKAALKTEDHTSTPRFALPDWDDLPELVQRSLLWDFDFDVESSREEFVHGVLVGNASSREQEQVALGYSHVSRERLINLLQYTKSTLETQLCDVNSLLDAVK